MANGNLRPIPPPPFQKKIEGACYFEAWGLDDTMAHDHNHDDHHHHHSAEERKALQQRLRKIAGQIRAIEGMVDEHTDCSEVLTQVISVRKALKSFAEILIKQHTESCIAGASDPAEGQRRLKELSIVLKRYVE
jgi:DNA-binding FrmR family transcriptional regulator